MAPMTDKIEAKWMDQFKRTLNSFTDVPEHAWNAMSAQLKYLKIKKDGYFVKSGDTPDKLAFIASGVFRVFFISESGDERTLVFREEGRMLSAFSPFLANKKSWFNIQALEDADLLYLNIDAETLTFNKEECWQTIYSKYVEMLFIEKENREREFLSDDAETRYRNFLSKYPGLENRINQYHIASYLGITPVALSRIRKNRK